MDGHLKEPSKAEEQDFEDTEQLSQKAATETDNVGDASVEINLEELLADVEAEGLPTEHFEEAAARKKLDDLLEEKRLSEEIVDFEDFEFE